MKNISFDMSTCHQGLLTLGDVAHIKSDKIALFTLSFLANYIYGDPFSLIQHHDPTTLLKVLNGTVISAPDAYSVDRSLLFQRTYMVSGFCMQNNRHEMISLPTPQEFNNLTRRWLGQVYVWWQNKSIKEFSWLPLMNNEPDLTRSIWETLKNIHFGSSPRLVSLSSDGIIRLGNYENDHLIDSLTLACGDRYQFAVYAYLALVESSLERKTITASLAKLVANRKNKLKKRISRN